MGVGTWYPFDRGATIGNAGSEGGTILRDEECSLGARITLEQSTQSAPYAITCGVYGWMVHTRFFSVDAEAHSQYERMKDALWKLLAAAQGLASPECEEAIQDGVTNFIENYP
jgi:hypothetical protein